MSIRALETFLSPIQTVLDRSDVSEISINQPKEVWVEARGEMERIEVPQFDIEHLKSLARLVAQSTEQKISEENPLLSANLPDGYRIQVVFPPATENGKLAMSIRKPTVMNLDLDAYERIGAFDMTTVGIKADPHDKMLRDLLNAGKIKQFIAEAVRVKKNMIISGGTSTGKTTFLNAALKAIPPGERLISVEDAREIELTNNPNHVHLLSSKGGQGRAQVTTQDLIEACLRLRPDRLILGELRGKEAFSYLRAVNTGHPGSISTLHADTPELAIEQLILMIMQAGLGITREQIKQYVQNVIHVIVQLKRGDKGKRYVSEIYFKEVDLA